ncbi:MAG: hypothetical protein LBP59_14745 [Planctomycetaceae bacterium]|nr:hypothetical protein [Planctomycetaceae bacterium]
MFILNSSHLNLRFTFACSPKTRQAKVNENSSVNSLKLSLQKIITTAEYLQKTTSENLALKFS